MKSKIIFAFLLLLITFGVVKAQDPTPTSTEPNTIAPPTTPTSTPTSTEPNAIESCLELRQCGEDQACRAKCAGVPNPTEQQVNDTRACIGNCITTNPSDPTCRDSCIDTYYNPKTTSTTSSSSSATSTATNSSPHNNGTGLPTPISGKSGNSNFAIRTTSSFGSSFTLLLAFVIVALMSVG